MISIHVTFNGGPDWAKNTKAVQERVDNNRQNRGEPDEDIIDEERSLLVNNQNDRKSDSLSAS